MNIKRLAYYLSFFCFPIIFFSFLNILYSSYFDYFLSLESYTVTLFVSLLIGFILYFFGKNSEKKISFLEKIILIILVYLLTSFLFSIPYYLSNYQIPFINSFFESLSGVTGTGFTIFENIKYLDPTLILWRSSSQWVGGLYFLTFLVLFFTNDQFNYKLNNLVFNNFRDLNRETNIYKTFIKLFFLYAFLTILIFIFFTASNIRLFDGLNLSMTIISAGGFLPTNSLNQIIKNNTQEIVLAISYFLSIFNIFFIFNIFSKKNIIKDHYEDCCLFILVLCLTILSSFMLKDLNTIDNLLNILSSVANSGLSKNIIQDNYSIFFLFLTIVGGSIISNTSGIKFLRIYILLKTSFIEILKLVRPHNVSNQNILFSEKKINNENIKLSFLIFISFFISLLILTSILIIDDINFENSFKLSFLTLTNTTISGVYGIKAIDFGNLLTSSKLFIILFMIIGKIELISFFLIIKNIFFKN